MSIVLVFGSPMHRLLYNSLDECLTTEASMRVNGTGCIALCRRNIRCGRRFRRITSKSRWLPGLASRAPKARA